MKFCYLLIHLTEKRNRCMTQLAFFRTSKLSWGFALHRATHWAVDDEHHRLCATTTSSYQPLASILVHNYHCTSLIPFRQLHISLAGQTIPPPVEAARRGASRGTGTRRRTVQRQRVWNSFQFNFAISGVWWRVYSVWTAAGLLAGRQT